MMPTPVDSAPPASRRPARRPAVPSATRMDPNSVTPTGEPGARRSPHPSYGLGPELAMEAAAPEEAHRSQRDSKCDTSSSGGPSSSSGGSGLSSSDGSTSPVPHPAEKTRRKKKKRTVAVRRRRLLKTPTTVATRSPRSAPAFVGGTPTPTSSTSSLRGDEGGSDAGGRVPRVTASSSSAAARRPLPRGGAFVDRGGGDDSSGAIPSAAASAPPPIPSPQSSAGSRAGGGMSTSAVASGRRGGGGGGAQPLLLRPRPAAPPLPPPPPPPLFPHPSEVVDQATLRRDDPRYWLYDVGLAANPRSVNSATQLLRYQSECGHIGGGGGREAMTPPLSFASADSADGAAVVPDGVQPWTKQDFDFGTQLGKGKFGIVYDVKEKNTGVPMALKLLHKNRVLKCGVAPKLLRREVEIQSRLTHENIVRLHGYFHNDGSVCLLLQHSPHGDLYQLMNKRTSEGIAPGGALPHPVAASFTAQVASALSYLGRYHIAHRDIKPENLLLSGLTDGEPTPSTTVKLADFGWAVRAPPPLHHRRDTLCGTPEYVPPEMVRHSPRLVRGGAIRSDPSPPPRCGGGSTDTASSSGSESSYGRNYDARYVDAWALGVLACEMVRGNTPFYLSQDEQKRIADERGYATAHETVFDLIREFQPEVGVVAALGECAETNRNEWNFVRLARALLRDIPESRMDVNRVAFHSWVTDAMGTVGPDKKRGGVEPEAASDAAQRSIKRVKTTA